MLKSILKIKCRKSFKEFTGFMLVSRWKYSQEQILLSIICNINTEQILQILKSHRVLPTDEASKNLAESH